MTSLGPDGVAEPYSPDQQSPNLDWRISRDRCVN